MVTTPTKKTVDIRREVKVCPTCKYRFSRDAAFCPFDGVKLEPAPFDPLADPLVGTRVDGRYDVVSILGEGGMGRIYHVRHAALDRSFAMKVLRPELAQEADLASRFILEAKATASVKHPNVVQITDFGRMPDGVPYFVMELLIGHTLGELIKAGGPLPAARAARILRKVAGALAAAHAVGVVHRDLKPDNVFLVGGSRDLTAPSDPERGRSLALVSYGADVRVVDFGAAKIVGTSRVTRAGVVFGTPHYMSPEQASGQELDQRADIYSLGVIMYEMFTGHVPFEADTYMGVLTQHMFVKPVPPSQVADSAKELGALEAITLKCLEKQPEDRYASMDDVVLAIDQLVQVSGDDGMPPTPSSSWSPADPGGLSARGRASRVPPVPQSSAGAVAPADPPTFDELRAAIDGAGLPRSRGAWVALVVVVGLALGILGATRWRGSRESTHTAAAPREVPPAGGAESPVAPPGSAATVPAVRAIPPVVSAPPAPIVGEGRAPEAAGSSSVGTPPAPRRRPAAADVTEPRRGANLDDVGDPFAAKH
jgi:eukaryotic-like serine/threonine-protein kinase